MYYFWYGYHGPEAKRSSLRLKALYVGTAKATQSLIKHRLLAGSPKMEALLSHIPRIRILDRFIYQAGMSFTVSVFIAITLITFISSVALFLIIGLTVIPAIAIGIVIGAVPFLYLKRAKNRRINNVEQKLPDALDLMVRALKVGHAFPSAIQMVGTEMTGPISSEFAIVFDEINYGLSEVEALTNLLARVPSSDLNYFVIAVVIHSQTGGNLAELFSNLSSLIRARLLLLGNVRVLSAEGRLSAWILTLLPFIIALLLFFINPNFFNVLFTDPLGIKIITTALILMVVGIFWMVRIVNIRV
jgi:tight adherence protein B